MKRRGFIKMRVGLAIAMVVAVPLAITAWLRFQYGPVPVPTPEFFASQYPVHPDQIEELHFMRTTGKLEPTNAILIREAIKRAGLVYEIPESLLWCLLFQESRLNHLQGFDGAHPSYGLGQFTHFGFFEVNYQLSRFNPQGKASMIKLLGRDVRPVTPSKTDIFDPSSYFYIPTAVVTTATFLKNRYLHLHKTLSKRSIAYNPDILWLYSVMAYNKGTRSVLRHWTTENKKHGSGRVRELLRNENAFFKTLSSRADYEDALSSIWKPSRAAAYAEELVIHMKNITACSIPSRHLSGTNEEGTL